MLHHFPDFTKFCCSSNSSCISIVLQLTFRVLIGRAIELVLMVDAYSLDICLFHSSLDAYFDEQEWLISHNLFFHCISLVIHASFYTSLEQNSMHYWNTFLYIVGTYIYILLLVAGDAASLIAEDLLKPSPSHERCSPASPTQPSHVSNGSW
jgi:cytosine/uracil/thiamine/allantoin permease